MATEASRLAANARALKIFEQRHPGRVRRNGATPLRSMGGRPRMRSLPSIGSVSGDLTVTGYILGSRGGVKKLIVRCRCGSDEHTVLVDNVLRGRTQRCLICRAIASGKSRTDPACLAAMPEDNHRRRNLARLWAAERRCHNPKDPSYSNYGARGIRVCEKWREDPAAFLRCIRKLHGWNNPKLDMSRIDNERGYEPRNIKFAPHRKNLRERRTVSSEQALVQELRGQLAELKAIHRAGRNALIGNAGGKGSRNGWYTPQQS
jgi:hypothetical protein